MDKKESIIALLRQQQSYLADEYGVKRIGLFGSYASGDVYEDSDVDVLLEFSRPIGLRFMELGDYLEEVLGRSVDVLTPAGLSTIRHIDIAKQIEESIIYV